MRFPVTFLFGLLLGACTAYQPAAYVESHVSSASELAAKTVALVKPTEDGPKAFCSGVWISETSILTAKHCVANDDIGDSVAYLVQSDVFDGKAESADMRPRAARLAAIDPDHDLALLVAAKAPEGHAVAALRVGDVAQGEFSQAMGHSLGLWYSYSSGVIAAVRELDLGDGAQAWVQTTTPVSPGNSGGGLFDSQGRLLGICHGSFTRGQAINLFVHVQYAITFVGKT